MPTPLPPPPPPTSARVPRRFWFTIPLFLGGTLAIMAVVFFGLSEILFGAPSFSFLQNRSAPSGWKTPPSSQAPADSALVGTWRPGDPGRNIPFANGSPNTLTPDQTLIILPDHTFRFTRQPFYDGRSRLICLRSDTGHWFTGVNNDGLPELTLVADFDSIRIDKTAIPDFNEDKDSEAAVVWMKAHPTDPYRQQGPNQVKDDDNAANCSSSAHRDNFINQWRVVTGQGGRLGIFRDAPGMPYESTVIPWHIVRVEQILYERDRP